MKSRGKPIFDSSNIDMESISGYRRFEPIIPLARIFVLVPISVQQPPKIDAYETGISILDEEIPNDFDNAITTGKSTTTTGVLLIKADTIATKQSSIIKNFR